MTFAELLMAAPNSQLDAKMKPLIEEWSSPPTALQILEVLDHCIHGSLASGFVVSALQAQYDLALQSEGKTHDELVPLATWRASQ